MGISLIAAMDRNRVIGRDNSLPWRLPADLRYFRRVTTGHPIIMGRRNFESIGRPLPQRLNIVLSRDPAFQAPGCVVANSLDAALEAAGRDPEIFIIGGAELYAQTLNRANRLYLTLIDAEFDGDVRFPEFDWQDWSLVLREDHARDEQNPYRYSFVVLERKRGD